MRIFSVTNQNNQKTPAFRGPEIFNAIKSLPEMNCVICNKPTLRNDLYVKTLTPLSKSLAYNMGKGVLEYVERKYPLVWAQLQAFAEKYPKASLDEILDDNNGAYVELKQSVVKTLEPMPVPHFTPERIELERNIGKVFFDTIDSARSYMKSSSVVMKQLAPLKGFLSDIQKEVFEQFDIYSRKYPRKSLSEIVNFPEIQKFHSAKNLLQRIEAREKLDYHFENIKNLVKKKNPKAVEHFDALKEQILEMYEDEKDEKARVYNAKEMYKTALKEYDCSSIEQEVLEEFDKIPKTFMTKDSFFSFAFNHEYTDFQIVKSLFSGWLASEDHIIPVSRGGEDRLENKVVAHRMCNSCRASKPYSEVVKYHTEMPLAAQRQVSMVAENVLNGNLSQDFLFYPVKVAENIARESEGAIDVDITEYCTKGIEQSIARADDNENNISSLILQKQAINQQISDLVDSNKKERNLQNRMKEYLERH